MTWKFKTKLTEDKPEEIFDMWYYIMKRIKRYRIELLIDLYAECISPESAWALQYYTTCKIGVNNSFRQNF